MKMSPHDYLYRRKTSGENFFYLVKYWIKDGFHVEEITQQRDEDGILSVETILVKEIDPNGKDEWGIPDDKTLDWGWDDTVAYKELISRSRAQPVNSKEMLRVDQCLQDARSKKESLPEGVELGGEVEANIEYLKRVKGRFWQWFYEAGIDPPTTEHSSESLPSGFEYAERLYDYLDLGDTDPESLQYTQLKRVYEAASEDSPEHFIVSYNGLYSALKSAGFYRSSSSNTTQSRKDNLVEMCRRIIRYVEDGEHPDSP